MIPGRHHTALHTLVFLSEYHGTMSRRKGVLAPTAGEMEDPLGLDVENSSTNFPEDQLQVCDSAIHVIIVIATFCVRKCSPRPMETLGQRGLTPPTFCWSTITPRHLTT